MFSGFLVALLLSFSCNQSSAVDCENYKNFNGRLTACVVDMHQESLGLYWRDKKSKPYASIDVLKNDLENDVQKIIFAMNAGMYQQDLTPMGLFYLRL